MSAADAPSPNRSEKAYRIVLWGSTQVGKTTSLAAYLGLYIPDWIDREDRETTATIDMFLDIWNKLQGNQLVGGTPEAKEFYLRHHRGIGFRFRDMRGGDAESLRQAPADAEALRAADAVLLFVEWPGECTHHRLQAAFNALQVLPGNRPAALVITKCEGYVQQEDFPTFALDPFSFKTILPDALQELLQTFRERCARGRVFPSTVYGWNAKRPAHFYDELGRQVPWKIRPLFADRPFEFILSQLLEGNADG